MYVSYENLVVYRRAFQASLDVHKLSLGFPAIEQYHGIGDQIRRSSKSICANIAEGFSKQTSQTEEKRFLGMALGSCEETRVWLHYAFKLGYIDTVTCNGWRKEYREIAKILTTLYRGRTAKDKKGGSLHEK